MELLHVFARDAKGVREGPLLGAERVTGIRRVDTADASLMLFRLLVAKSILTDTKASSNGLSLAHIPWNLVPEGLSPLLG